MWRGGRRRSWGGSPAAGLVVGPESGVCRHQRAASDRQRLWQMIKNHGPWLPQRGADRVVTTAACAQMETGERARTPRGKPSSVKEGLWAF